MEDFQINLFAFLGVLELAMVLLVVALLFVVRNKHLSSRVRALKKELKEAAQDEPATVGFDQYLRDEVIRNQDLIDSATASQDDAEKKAGELLQLQAMPKIIASKIGFQTRAIGRTLIDGASRIAAINHHPDLSPAIQLRA